MRFAGARISSAKCESCQAEKLVALSQARGAGAEIESPIEQCRRCGGRLRVIASIEAPVSSMLVSRRLHGLQAQTQLFLDFDDGEQRHTDANNENAIAKRYRFGGKYSL